MFKCVPSFGRPRGISLVEVIISIGVILIGLLGVMSILPLAGRRAQDAINLSVGAAMGDAVTNEILSKRWRQQDKLRVRWGSALFSSITVPADPPASIPLAFPMSVLQEPICIDPMWVHHPASSETAPVAVGSYHPSFFPYFHPGYDPRLNPARTDSRVLAEGNSVPAPLRRMLRVGVMRNSTTTLLSRFEALGLTERSDDLRIDRPKDRSLPARINSSRFNSGARFANGEYSWIATVVPEPATTGYATLSVVTLRNRQRTFDFPTENEQDPQANGQSERLALVVDQSGFVGGAGGSVTIRSSLNTLSRIEGGSWVLMSGFSPHLHPNPPYPHIQMPIHRWYRVAAVDANPLNDLAVGTWTRTLQLDGPDWQFNIGSSFVTLVEGAVSVTNTTVRINAL